MLWKTGTNHTFQLFFAGLLLSCVILAQNGQNLMSDDVLKQVGRAYGEQGRKVFAHWVEFVTEQSPKEAEVNERQVLDSINRYFNERLKFVSDSEHWQQEDYWATPLESLSTAAGDCEDYVIAKYFSLIQAGIAQDKLRITYVKAVRLNQAHMVLAYYETPKSEPLILDNLKPDILRASKRRDLVPVYSFNGIGLWLERQQGSIKVGNADGLGMWMDLLTRMEEQGLGPWMQLPHSQSATQ